MEPWDFRLHTSHKRNGSIKENRVELLSQEAWIVITLADGSAIRVQGNGVIDISTDGPVTLVHKAK